MPSSSDKEDVDIFIQAVLQQQPHLKVEPDKQTFFSMSNDPLVSFVPETLPSLTQKKNGYSEINPKFHNKPPMKGINRPKDYLKNMYNNSLKYIVKRYISKTYQVKVQKIHKKIGIVDSQSAKNYYRIRQQETIGLTNLCDLLNYQIGEPKQKMYKRAFRFFYIWFMKYRYPIHILETEKMQHADVYWKAKNILIYLPQRKHKDTLESSDGIVQKNNIENREL